MPGSILHQTVTPTPEAWIRPSRQRDWEETQLQQITETPLLAHRAIPLRHLPIFLAESRGCVFVLPSETGVSSQVRCLPGGSFSPRTPSGSVACWAAPALEGQEAHAWAHQKVNWKERQWKRPDLFLNCSPMLSSRGHPISGESDAGRELSALTMWLWGAPSQHTQFQGELFLTRRKWTPLPQTWMVTTSTEMAPGAP